MKKLSLLEVVALAVGTMIGASIFTMLGLGAEIAGRNLPLVFVLSGLLAFLVGYSYAKLGSRIVSNAGPISFVVAGFGDGVVSGALAILMWFTYVVSIALFAKGFSGYFLPLLGLPLSPLGLGLTETGAISLFVALNFFGAKSVGRAEFWIVVVKLLVLGLFVVVGLAAVRPEWIVPGLDATHLGATLSAVSIFFLSYMGFGLVTNASEAVENPERTVPLAIYLAIAIAAVVYVLVAVVAVGTLPLSVLIQDQEYALARAAEPTLGRFGYVLVSVGALFSIASALNATLYGGANVAYALAKDGDLPEIFERKVWFGTTEGLYITALLGLVLALGFDLAGIAGMTSTVFMVIYLFVIAAHGRLIAKGLVPGRTWVVTLAFLTVLVAFFALESYQWRTSPAAFWTTQLAFVLALALEAVYRGTRGRKLSLKGIPGSPGATGPRS